MKKLSKLSISTLGITAILSAAAISLPIVKTGNNNVNVRSTIKSNDQPNIRPTNIPNLKIMLTKESYYEIKFVTNSSHPDWGVYGSVIAIKVAARESIPKLTIPGTVIQQGEEYKVRSINTTQYHRGYVSEIKCLDLSQAEWLDSIDKDSFRYYNSGENFFLRSVDFRGAKRLTHIGESCFAHQFFDNTVGTNNNILDLSSTLLTHIENDAFWKCCDDNKNVFNGIIFPPTLIKVGINAFSTDGNESCRIRFKNIVFTNPNPPTNLFADGIPRVADKSGLGIVVPYGCKDQYINHTGFDKTYAKNVHESNIWLDPTWQKSSTNISAIVGRAGADKYHWKAIDQELGKEVKVDWWISDDLNGNLNIDKDGLVTWKNTIPSGVHKFRVYCFRYDDPDHKTISVDCSNEITISVFKAELEGGNQYLNIIPGTAGQDTRKWIAVVDKIPGVSQKTEFKPKVELLNLPEELKGHVIAERSDDLKSITIKWDNQVPTTAKSCTVTLKTEVWNECDNSFFLYKNIYLDFDTTVQKKINVLVAKDDGASTPYIGDLIEIGENEKLTFTLLIPDGATDPELAIENIKPKKQIDEGVVKYTFEFNNSSFKATVGKYNFFAHSTITESGITYDIYSPTININIKGSCEDAILSRIPDEIEVTKEVKGNKAFKLINDDKNSIITSAFAIPASWNENDTRLANQKLIFSVDEEDNKSVSLTWTDDYSQIEDKYDTLDIMLEIHVHDQTSHKNSILHKALTIKAVNKCEVNYLGEESVIQTYPSAKIYSKAPFEFKINGGVTTPSSVTLECFAQDEEGAETETSEILNKYISMEPVNDNAAYLVCDLKNATAEEQEKLLGMHNILVYGYDEYNMCLGYTTIPLKNSNEIEILDAPESLNMIVGKSGTDTTQLWTSFNGTVIENPVYTLETELGSHIWVNESNFIQWDDKLEPGYYDVVLYSKHIVTEDVEEYTAARHIEVRVILSPVPEPKTNVAAIVGGTVGGLIVAGGAATGIAVGVNKHKKAKKTK